MNDPASSRSVRWVAPVAQPGTAVSVVMATPTTGASVAVHGCRMEFRWYSPLPYGVMSAMDSGYVRARRPVAISTSDTRSSLTRMMQPCFTVGEIMKPRSFMMRLPFVVSTTSTASSCVPPTSSRFTSAVATGDPMNATGSCGNVGACGHTCVETNTSPGSTSPRACIDSSFAAQASAVSAPSPSDTKPMRSGRAPKPPKRPSKPMVGASPPAARPREPGMRTRTMSVEPFGPSSTYVSASHAGSMPRRYSTTPAPLAEGESSRS